MSRTKFAVLYLLSLPLIATLGSIAAYGDDAKPHVVMLIGEQEYDTKTTLPQFAKQYLEDKYDVSFVYANEEDPNSFDEIEQVREADILLLSVRRRTPPPAQLAIIRDYVESGRPVIGIRTASHAFSVRNQKVPEKHSQWLEWDRDVFGGNYSNHHGNDLHAVVRWAEGASTSAILQQDLPIDQTWTTGGSLYQVSPLQEGTRILLTGVVAGHPSEPVAWTFRRVDGGASFYTSLGHPDDFTGTLLPQLLVNAIAWASKEAAAPN